jgi:hypothetical protein
VSVRFKLMSAATVFLGSRLRFPQRAWMFVSCVCCVGSGICDVLITRSEESYRLCARAPNCVRYRSLNTEGV